MHLNYKPVRRRCISCGFKNWETSSSYYVRTLGELKDFLDELGSEHVMTAEELSYVEEALGELRNHIEEGIDSMPENLLESAPVQERQDQLDLIDSLLDEFPDAIDEATASDVMDLLSELEGR